MSNSKSAQLSQRNSLAQVCKSKLLEQKESLLNQFKTLQTEFNLIDKSRGDESDLSYAHQEEHQFLITQSRIKFQLQDIENALSRIENGTFGICEVTLEPIEISRLKALPWTRVSIEGAEILEAHNSKSFLKSV